MREETVLEREERAKALPTPHRAGQDPAACGGLKPFSVMCKGPTSVGIKVLTLRNARQKETAPICESGILAHSRAFGGDDRIRTGDKGFADPRLNHLATSPGVERETGFEPATLTLAR